MEKQHSGYAYPRNFFGVLTSLLLEERPITQERIMRLTGYSRAGVSAALQKIQFMMPIVMTKRSGDRRNYYEYGGSSSEFLADLMSKRADTPDLDPDLLEMVRAKAARLADAGPLYLRLCKHLRQLRRIILFMAEIRAQAETPLKESLAKGDASDIELPDPLDVWRSLPDEDRESQDVRDAKAREGYHELKREFFAVVRRSLNPLFSQAAAKNLVVVHDVMIEGETTQEEIEESTGLPRSTISEILKSAVTRGLLEAERESGSRIKRYRPKVSLSELLVVHYRRASIYATSVKSKLIELMDRVEDEDDSLRPRLSDLKRAYAVLEEFASRMHDSIVGAVNPS